MALAQTGRHLMDDVFSAPSQPQLRIAVHYGEVQTGERNVDLKLTIVGGAAILCAARVEPVVELFNVKKSGSLAPDLWVRLHRPES